MIWGPPILLENVNAELCNCLVFSAWPSGNFPCDFFFGIPKSVYVHTCQSLEKKKNTRQNARERKEGSAATDKKRRSNETRRQGSHACKYGPCCCGSSTGCCRHRRRRRVCRLARVGGPGGRYSFHHALCAIFAAGASAEYRRLGARVRTHRQPCYLCRTYGATPGSPTSRPRHFVCDKKKYKKKIGSLLTFFFSLKFFFFFFFKAVHVGATRA